MSMPSERVGLAHVRIAAAFDASRLVGRVLQLVSFSENTVHLSFSDDTSITIEGSYTHSMRGGLEQDEAARPPLQQSRLMQLVGQPIEHARPSGGGALRLDFANGQTLTCQDDSSQYEAYRIKIGSEEIVV